MTHRDWEGLETAKFLNSPSSTNCLLYASIASRRETVPSKPAGFAGGAAASGGAPPSAFAGMAMSGTAASAADAQKRHAAEKR